MEGVMGYCGGGEAVIEKHRHQLLQHLHKSNSAVVLSTLGGQNHRLSRGLFLYPSLPEVCLY